MLKEKRIAVVIPAYRVEKQIGGVLRKVPEIVAAVFVVDDASPDGTSEAVRTVSDGRIRLIRNERNLGVGGATVTGMIAALEDGADIVVKCDGDGQMDPAAIPLLVAPLLEGAADHAKGTRFHHFPELSAMPKFRLIGNVVLTFLTKLACGYWNVTDPVNGFFATRAETLRRIPLRRVARRYFFETDLLIRLNIVEARVIDIPLPARYGGEPSSLSPASSLVTFPPRLLLGGIRRVFWRYLFYDSSPVGVFALVGALLTGFGTVFGLWNWIPNASRGVPTPLGTIMVAAIPFILGFQILLQAVVLDIQNAPRPDLRTSNPPGHSL